MPENVQPPLTEETIRETLRTVKFPGFSRDIVSFGIVHSIRVGPDNAVDVLLQVATRDTAIPTQIVKEAETALTGLGGRVSVRLATPLPATAPPPTSPTTASLPRIAGVQHVIAVGSGKGGVGKSTVAVNLACALRQMDCRVGLLDADIYGPSVPKMMGTTQRPTVTDEKLDPVEQFGLRMMSMALLLEDAAPVIWRGPMIMKALQQFTQAVNWGALDVLVVDLPPGTGDAQISLAQTIALDGGVIVTTPQDVALEVARRGIAMLEKMNVRILGIVENMSYYVCPHCRQHDDIFGHGGGRQEAELMQVPFLGEIPIDTGIRVCGDRGVPVVMAEPESGPADAFRRCARSVLNLLEKP